MGSVKFLNPRTQLCRWLITLRLKFRNCAGTLPNGSPICDSGDERVCSSSMEGNSSYDSNLYPGVAQIQDCRMIHMPIDYIDDQ